MDTDQLAGKVAVVTGASRGIGRAIAIMLAGNGVNVALAARTEPDLLSTREQITSGGGNAVAVSTDITREPDVKRLVKTTVDTFGRLDIVVNNAGMGVFRPIEQIGTEDWDRVMAVNARGPFMLCRESLPHLRQNGKTTWIINVGSVVSLKGYANQAAYTASKHALLGMTKALAQELYESDVRVHAICPGGVDTNLIAQARPDLDPAILMEPDDIAEIVLFLLTRRGNAIVDEINVRRSSSPPWF